MTLLLDYSAGKISGAAIKAAGYSGSIRYITDRNSLSTKHTDPAEYADHVANGLEVFLVYEVGVNDPLNGFAGGVTAANRALDGANFIGYPGYKPIFMAFDRHALSSELPAWQSYLDGAASVLGVARTGAYGFSESLAAAQGHATSFWQCGSRSALLGNTNVYQRNTGSVTVGGIDCDVNDVLIPLPTGGGSSTTSSSVNLNSLEDNMAELAAGNRSQGFACKGAKQAVITSPYAEDLKIHDCVMFGPYGTTGDNTSGRGNAAPDGGFVRDHYDWVINLPADILSLKLWWEIKDPSHAGSIQFVY